MSNRNRSWRLASVMASASLIGGPLVAQQANEISSPQLPDNSGNMESFTLDGFTVTGDTDVGYVAVDSLAGGRINTPIKLTPSAISSLTDEFLKDVGVHDTREALKWTINVTPADPTAGKSSPFNSWDYNFRGAGQNLQGGSGPTRNYFTSYQVSDAYNLERLEFDRGPNAILFGVGTVGGVVSSYTKVPRVDRDFVTPRIQVDDRGSLRLELDANYRLSDFGAVRLNLLRDRQKGWRDNDESNLDAATIAFLFKLSEKTTLRAEYEHSESERTIISNTLSESVSLWNGTTSASTWGEELDTSDPQVVEGAPGVRYMRESSYPIWVAGQPEIGLQDWAGGYSSSGTYLPMAPEAGFYPDTLQATWQPMAHPDPSRIPVLPSGEWNLSSSDSLSEPEFDVGTVWLDHRFTDNFEVSVSGYRYEDDHWAQNYERTSSIAVDLNEQLPDGSVNPNFGKLYGDYFASKQNQQRTVSEGRVQATYRFDSRIGEVPWEQVFTLSGGVQEIEWSARQYNAQIIDDNPDNWWDNMVWVRLYEDQPHAAAAVPDSIGELNVEYAALPIDWFDFDETYELSNMAFVSQTRLWEDRFNLLVGARQDSYDYERLGANTGNFSSHSADGTSYSAGAVYYFGPVGVFANHATNFDPIGPGRAPKLDGTSHEAAEGSGQDFGIRISTADNNYYATLSRYESESEGRITGSKIGLSRIWQLYYEATGQPEDSERVALSFDDTESLKVSGYEFEVVANPIQGLRLQAGFAKPDSQIVEAMAGQRAYVANFVNEWNTAASTGTPEAIELQNALNNAQQLLDQNADGKTKVGLVDYTANVFARYSFSDGWLSGFSVGGGAAFIGEQYVGEVQGESRYMDERVTTNLSLSYDTEIAETPTRFSIHVDNLFDEEEFVVTSYDGGWLSNGNAIRNGYYYATPRTVRFTASMDF